MGKVVTVTVPIPTNGITNDPRDRTPGVARMITNFDIATDTERAVPYYDSEDGDSSASTSKKENFCIAHWLPGSTNEWRLFALGVVSGTGRAEVLMKTLSTGGSNDLGDATWATPANNQSASGTANMNLFVFYKKTGLIYGARAGTAIWAFDAATAGAWADTNHSLTYTNIAQGLVHSQDDVLYIPYDNKIAKNDNGSWTDAALTLPSEFYITSISEYGTFLAIACSPLSGVGRSRVYLWNRSSSLSTVSANIDWGDGTIKVLEELQGDLIGISVVNDASRNRNRVIFRKYMGAPGAQRFHELTGTITSFPIAKQKINNRLYFMMQLSLNGSSRDGVWSVTKNEASGRLSIVHERTPQNDTSISSGPLKGFFFAGDYLFQSYVNASAAYALYKTNNAASYTATSLIETVVNPNIPAADWHAKKKLISIGAMYDPLPSAGQAVIKARVDSSGSYTTVLTETTDGVAYTEPVPLVSSGALLNDGKEIEFRVESTGGAILTGFTYKYEVLESNV